MVTAIVALSSLGCGFRLGRRAHRPNREQEAQIRTIVGAAVGLMTFMLVFTFWIASSHFNKAREAVLDEAGAIGTAYLNADMLPEPYREEIRNLIREYVNVYLEGVQSGKINQTTSQLEEVRRRIWSRAMDGREKTADPYFDSFLSQSLSKFIDLHTRRVGVQKEFNIPSMVWVALYLIIALAMVAIGYHAAMTNMRRTPVIPVFVIILSVVMVLIADLDNPHIGGLRVNHWALIELRNAMNAPNG